MKLFRKKEKIFLRSEQQKQEWIEKLENAHIRYSIHQDEDSAPGHVISLYADDLKLISK